MKSSIDNSVNLGGTQNVRGLKEFSADVAADDLNDTSHYNMIVKCKAVDNKVAPSSAVDYGGIDFRDKNGFRIGKIEVGHTNEGLVTNTLSVSRVVDGKYSFFGANVKVASDGYQYSNIPSMAMPLWAAGFSISSGYVCVRSGYVRAYCYGSSSTSTSDDDSFGAVLINGNLAIKGKAGWSYTNVGVCGMVAVRKGDTITTLTNHGGTVSNLSFIPCVISDKY